ncbi:hypothetical protein COLSTE_01340 [Collinsella stercoris DSM 13279]|uniref:Uncharacterized protein n=1 Tax=Collinsella stercoris DSM 13279 TaxID=445975 RepID=B6GB82_9ACTN|nr:hypothetical protein COLSTE_01340 [Collinsella stercoris DSM 13279]
MNDRQIVHIFKSFISSRHENRSYPRNKKIVHNFQTLASATIAARYNDDGIFNE